MKPDVFINLRWKDEKKKMLGRKRHYPGEESNNNMGLTVSQRGGSNCVSRKCCKPENTIQTRCTRVKALWAIAVGGTGALHKIPGTIKKEDMESQCYEVVVRNTWSRYHWNFVWRAVKVFLNEVAFNPETVTAVLSTEMGRKATKIFWEAYGEENLSDSADILISLNNEEVYYSDLLSDGKIKSNVFLRSV